MGEQIKRYQTSFSADDDVVLASDHDREIAQRDARIVELEGDLNIARLERDAKLCTECPRGSVQAERDTAREMLVSARELLERANSGMLIQVIDDDEKMREYLVKAEAEQIKLFADIRVFLASLKE
jgi:hypothetical protein